MTATLPTFAPGSLVRVRDRDWVVLPSAPEDPDVLLLRPLGGTDQDATGIYWPLEGDQVQPASLTWPDPRATGDAVEARLLRDAVRLGFRSAAGPLRSLARIAVEPRPYQLVPLLMALRQHPVRLLIADDVGIGKTIEAALIARELLDRGEIRRLAVLCPPHLCEQWEKELREKFHLDAVVVRPGTAGALERAMEREGVNANTHSIFEFYSVVVVSIDYVKSAARHDEFIRACPECVIVDEAHGVAESGHAGAQQQRHALVQALCQNAGRHVLFTTATPHSGVQDAFASLVGLLVPDLEDTVRRLEYGATEHRQERERLARHFVQRRRGDIRRYLDAETDFPERLTAERTYRLTPAYRALLERVLAYAQEVVQGAEGGSAFRQRVRWWAALALLRCVSSSPAAAEAALRNRAPMSGAEEGDARAADALGAAQVLDLDQNDAATQDDATPGANVLPDTLGTATDRAAGADGDAGVTAEHRRLLDMARAARDLRGDADPKLLEAVRVVSGLLKEGCRPIVFCRYISTAQYVAQELNERLRGVTVLDVTGELPPEERERRVADLAQNEKRVLVATDCLSEGVNLQQGFDAVVHYDLAWNPTRHEQREGRVDRYGQRRPQVRAVLLYGQDNAVDGAVLKVLIRKAESIRKTLGVAVPVPANTEKLLEAIFDRLFKRGRRPSELQLELGLFPAEERQLDDEWESAAKREGRTRAVFAQHALDVTQVRGELDLVRAAIGSGADVRHFLEDAAERLGVPVTANADGSLTLELTRLPAAVLGRLDVREPGQRAAEGGLPPHLRAAFDPAPPDGAVYVARTHPLVEALSGYLVDLAIDQPEQAPARRAGAMRTAAVAERTVLLLLRARYLIRERRPTGEPQELLAEEALLAAFHGDYDAPEWLPPDEAERLARDARPARPNIMPAQAAARVQEVIDLLPALQPALDALAHARAGALRESHLRVRAAADLARRGTRVDAKIPADVLGTYVLLPAPRV